MDFHFVCRQCWPGSPKTCNSETLTPALPRGHKQHQLLCAPSSQSHVTYPASQPFGEQVPSSQRAAGQVVTQHHALKGATLHVRLLDGFKKRVLECPLQLVTCWCICHSAWFRRRLEVVPARQGSHGIIDRSICGTQRNMKDNLTLLSENARHKLDGEGAA